MDLMSLVQRIDARTARAFVVAARHVIDALLIEAEQSERSNTPTATDYEHAELPRSAPAGGWLSPGELRRTTQELAEAVAAERWVDGVLTTVRVLRMLGGL